MNSAIQNVFFAMNSLVAFTPVQGSISFINSRFDSISICGGLIKTTLSDLGLKPDITTALNNDYLSALQITKIVEIWSWQDKYKVDPVKSYYGNVPSVVSPACVTASTCYNVNIETTSFVNIPFGYHLLTSTPSFLVHGSNGLRD